MRCFIRDIDGLFVNHQFLDGRSVLVVADVQEMLGHESIATTEIYTHLDQDYLRTNIALFHPRY